MRAFTFYPSKSFAQWSKENPVADVKLTPKESRELGQLADTLNQKLADTIQKDLGNQLNILNGANNKVEANAARQQVANARSVLERELSQEQERLNQNQEYNHPHHPSAQMAVHQAHGRVAQLKNDIARLDQGIQHISSKFELGELVSAGMAHLNKENLLQVTRFAVAYGVPFGNVVNVVTGLSPMPQTAAEWRSLALDTAMEAAGGKVGKIGGKAFAGLRKLYTKCGNSKSAGYAMGVVSGAAGALGRKVEKTLHFGKLKVAAEVFYRQIKPSILKKAGNFSKVVGKNPDIKLVNGKIRLIGIGPFKGKRLNTRLDATDFFN